MTTSQDFVHQLRAGRSIFFLADFHVHSPASTDVRVGKRFDVLPIDVRTALENIPASLASSAVDYEKAVLREYPPGEYLKKLVEQRDGLITAVEPDIGSDWAIVAITDHNICEYSCALAALAYKNRKDSRLIVLPGMELDVTFPCPESKSKAHIHILCIFAPGVSASDIRIVIRESSGKNWTAGEDLEVDDLPMFVQSLRTHADWPALCIAAHVASRKGIQKEAKSAILSHIEAELSRLEGERQATEPDIEAIERQIATLEKRQSPDGIALQVLRLIGNCGFDALQVASTDDSVHYRRLHRFKDEHGRATPVLASDAHNPTDVFRAGSFYPHLKLPSLNSTLSEKQIHKSVRRALRYGETRFSASTQSPAQYWISGIQIIRDADDAAEFWPFKKPCQNPSAPEEFVVPLSRNLNTLVGGRGSGKSATLEAIAFVARPGDFVSAKSKRRELLSNDFYQRTAATLSGCQVKLCWQFAGSPNGKMALPKGALIAQRYFNPGSDHADTEYLNIKDEQLVPEQIPNHSVQMFRLGEIERLVSPARLRQLFDEICGSEINDLAASIQEIVQELEAQRASMIEIVLEIQRLTAHGAPLRDYARRMKLFDEVNTKELSEQCEEVDLLESAVAVIDEVLEAYDETVNPDSLESQAEEYDSLPDVIGELVSDDDGYILPKLEDLYQLFVASEEDESEAPFEAIKIALQKLTSEGASFRTHIEETKGALESQLGKARSVLEAKGLKQGTRDREAKRRALEETTAAHQKYKKTIGKWNKEIEKRSGLREELEKLVAARSELRTRTAEEITKRLANDLDESVLRIEVDAQAGSDKSDFHQWLQGAMRGGDFRYIDERIGALLQTELMPSRVQQMLFGKAGVGDAFVIRRSSAAKGNIDKDTQKKFVDRNRAIFHLEPEYSKDDYEKVLWKKLPKEIRDGLASFPGEQDSSITEQALILDEIVFDDVPEIRLNDRPGEPDSTLRTIENLSPGQRCSAVLPILLLTGTSPLIIDQPEDNLDNCLIRQVIVSTLASIKLRRQVIIATHNPNMPVLGDVESAIVLRGAGDSRCEQVAAGDLDSPGVAHHLTEVMEGGREAFQYRHAIYSSHWRGPVYESPVATG